MQSNVTNVTGYGTTLSQCDSRIVTTPQYFDHEIKFTKC